MHISVIIPALNEESTIVNILHDLHNQTLKVHEILVVDGGSEDRTAQVVRRVKQVKLLTTYKGIAHQRNVGGAKATGDILIFLDADVRIDPDFMENVHRFLVATHAEIACPRYIPYPGSFMINSVYTFLHVLFWMFSRITPSGAGSCIVVRSTLFRQVNGFHEHLKFDDIHFIRKAGSMARFKMMPFSVSVSDRRFRRYGVMPMILTYGVLSVLFFFGMYRLANIMYYPLGRYHTHDTHR